MENINEQPLKTCRLIDMIKEYLEKTQVHGSTPSLKLEFYKASNWFGFCYALHLY